MTQSTPNRRVKQAVALGGTALVAAAPLVTASEASATGYTVTNTNDSGAGSLRQAILDANVNVGPDTITFSGAGASGTITLTGGVIAIADSVTITGPGAATLAVDGNNTGGIFYISGGDTDVSISGLTLQNANYDNDGGAVRASGCGDLTLDHMAITNNDSTANGGGIYFDTSTGNLSITDSTISGNTASDYGGGIYVEDTNYAGGVGVNIVRSTISGNTTTGADGGGIFLYDPDGDIYVVDSTISDNTADGAAGGMEINDTDPFNELTNSTFLRTTFSGNTASGNGGGLRLYLQDTPTFIINSTFSGNSAGAGGGLYIGSSGPSVLVDHVTIAFNDATTHAGGVAIDGAPTTLSHTILSDNNAGVVFPDIDGSPASTIWSLVEDPFVVTLNEDVNSIIGESADLAALADNGGYTLTHWLNEGSPALDAGDPAYSSNPTTDQRGSARVYNGRIDMGAVEVAPEEPPVEPPLPPTGSSNGAMAALAGGLLAAGATMRRFAHRRPA